MRHAYNRLIIKFWHNGQHHYISENTARLRGVREDSVIRDSEEFERIMEIEENENFAKDITLYQIRNHPKN